MINIEQYSQNIDIREDYLLKEDHLLGILLQDKTTQKNILWATDSYEQKGEKYLASAYITSDLITGEKWKSHPVASRKKQRGAIDTNPR